MTTKFPASAVLIELATYMKKMSLRTFVEWAPKERAIGKQIALRTVNMTTSTRTFRHQCRSRALHGISCRRRWQQGVRQPKLTLASRAARGRRRDGDQKSAHALQTSGDREKTDGTPGAFFASTFFPTLFSTLPHVFAKSRFFLLRLSSALVRCWCGIFGLVAAVKRAWLFVVWDGDFVVRDCFFSTFLGGFAFFELVGEFLAVASSPWRGVFDDPSHCRRVFDDTST